MLGDRVAMETRARAQGRGRAAGSHERALGRSGAARAGLADRREGLAAEIGDSPSGWSPTDTRDRGRSERATFGAWYELFPRSGAARRVEKLLPEFAELGFDVLYLPPPSRRAHPSQGPQQRAGRAPQRPGQPVGHRQRARRAQGAPPRPRECARLRAADGGGQSSSGSQSRSTSRSSALPTIPGCASTPTGSTGDPTARSSTRKAAQALPGHLQRQLRHRGLARALERAARHRPALGSAGREGVPRRQSAYQADRRSGSG